jgi:multimeric flavodoxin WrbA
VSTANAPRVLGIVGSPRRHGNTEILVDEVLRGAAEAGAAVEKVLLPRLEVGPCLACDACRRTGTCAQRDDMPALLERMQASRVWVLGTPVYWFGPSAQMKAFIDRWYAITAEHAAYDMRGRRAILALAMEDDDPAGARHAVGILTLSVEWLKSEVWATILATRVGERGAVRDHPAVLRAAYQAGRGAIEDAGE